VTGGILVKKKQRQLGLKKRQDDPLRVHICATCVVEGELRCFERPVNCASISGKIGTVVGDEVTRPEILRRIPQSERPYRQTGGSSARIACMRSKVCLTSRAADDARFLAKPRDDSFEAELPGTVRERGLRARARNPGPVAGKNAYPHRRRAVRPA